MAGESGSAIKDFGTDGGAAFGDPTPEELAAAGRSGDTGAGSTQTPSDDGGAGAADGQSYEFLKGTSFQKPEDLVNGYKNLQRQLSTKDTQYQALNNQVQALIRQLAGQALGKTSGEVTKKDADSFLKGFLTDPEGTLETAFTRVVDQRFGKIEARLDGEQMDRAIDTFVAGPGKDLSETQQARFVELLQTDPDVRASKNPIQMAYRFLVAEDPAAFSKNASGASAGSQALKDAKAGAAGTAGKGSGAGGTQNKASGDAFDEVLSRYNGLKR